MGEYNFREIEKKWQRFWKENNCFEVKIDQSKPKFYSLDMFPYPSGAGLHVGHPLGYIASDIVSRYKRLKGFNVLHPMGFDAFGLPAEQYAIQTGQHPAITTETNINRYKEQLENVGFSFDWSKEVQTCNPSYYKWTQWIFTKLFEHYYDLEADKALPISQLISEFEKSGNTKVRAKCDDQVDQFTSGQWSQFDSNKKAEILLQYRLTYLAETEVNWCPALGTVLANDEVKDGFSERGGYPVERKKMKQWIMRITAYAERLLQGLETIDWPEPVKEMQRNWIGKSYGCSLEFEVVDSEIVLTVFTTRIDTTFGVTYLSIAPEHELVDSLTSSTQKEAVNEYVNTAKNRSERDRMTDVKTVSGVFTGSYAINPFNNEKIPIWIADYVLAGYGTGVVMAVPSSDERDFKFATHFELPIIQVQEGEGTDISKEGFDPKNGTMINSGFLNGLEVPNAIQKAIKWVEDKGVGSSKINYKMRNAVFSRQRYWGEPIPVRFVNESPQLIDLEDLPLTLPEVEKYLPTETGEPPLGNALDWKYKDGSPYELSTMPGWAGSSWYQFRYMDPENNDELISKEAQEYWQNVDLYIGGSEHATGHLLYSRFWTKFLRDIDVVTVEEPFKKLVNQGMIQGTSSLAYRINGTNKFVSYNLRKEYDCSPIHVDVSLVKNDILDIPSFRQWRPDLANAEFVMEDDKFVCGSEVEKMSKSKFNVVNPDDIIEKYGADTLRLYEMFLGPLEQFKPWNTNGIDGVFKFLRKVWRLFYDDKGNWIVKDGKAKEAELKVLHKTIKKVGQDIDGLSLNTSVSTFMIAANELTSLKCNKKEILEPFLIVLSPFAPHISEELWSLLGNERSIHNAQFPVFEEKYLVEASHEYPIMVNGKMRAKLHFTLDMSQDEMQEQVLANETIQKWTDGKAPKKVIIVAKKIINIVM